MNTEPFHCEHPGCRTQGLTVHDYVRLDCDIEEDEEGPLAEEERDNWLYEPIALCQKHAGPRTLWKP